MADRTQAEAYSRRGKPEAPTCAGHPIQKGVREFSGVLQTARLAQPKLQKDGTLISGQSQKNVL